MARVPLARPQPAGSCWLRPAPFRARFALWFTKLHFTPGHRFIQPQSRIEFPPANEYSYVTEFPFNSDSQALCRFVRRIDRTRIRVRHLHPLERPTPYPPQKTPLGFASVFACDVSAKNSVPKAMHIAFASAYSAMGCGETQTLRQNFFQKF